MQRGTTSPLVPLLDHLYRTSMNIKYRDVFILTILQLVYWNLVVKSSMPFYLWSLTLSSEMLHTHFIHATSTGTSFSAWNAFAMHRTSLENRCISLLYIVGCIIIYCIYNYIYIYLVFQLNPSILVCLPTFPTSSNPCTTKMDPSFRNPLS